MPPISQTKKDKISEQILHYLYTVSPSPVFTAAIASNIARDEEFTKSLLVILKSQNLVVEVNKNSQGLLYAKRQRWRLSDKAFEIYKQRVGQQRF